MNTNELGGTIGCIPPAKLSKYRAELLAQMNTASETQGWSYRAVPIEGNLNGLHYVEITDDKGVVVGYL